MAMAFMRCARDCRLASARASFLVSVRVTRWRRSASASFRLGVGRSFLATPVGSFVAGGGVAS